MCCCKRTRTGCCVCCATGQGQFFTAAVLALIAFGGAGWILSISNRTFVNQSPFLNTPTTIEATDFFQIGLLYPIAIVTVNEVADCGSITDSALYSSDASKLCQPVRNQGLTPENCHERRASDVLGLQAGCMAAAEICGSKFRTAAAFSFMQCLAALIAGILIAPALLTSRRACGAQALAAFSAVSGITALALVYAVKQEVSHAHSSGHPVFPGAGEGFSRMCGGGQRGGMFNSTVTSTYVGPSYSWYLSSISLFLTFVGMFRLWRYDAVTSGEARFEQAQASLLAAEGGNGGFGRAGGANIYQPCAVPSTVKVGSLPPSVPPLQHAPQEYGQQDAAFVPMALPALPDAGADAHALQLQPDADVVNVTCPEGIYGDGNKTICVQHPSSGAYYNVPVPIGIGPGQQFTAGLPALPKPMSSGS